MAEVVFFEKPGCINNSRQKKLLQQAGHDVVCHDLLQVPWTEAQLLFFFQGLPLTSWFNLSAPQIKSGEIKPDELDVSGAISAMLKEPILIRRPLMRCNNESMVGFDYQQVNDWIGLGQDGRDEDLETCYQK